jgi:predicted phage terminase large subunit-like protein
VSVTKVEAAAEMLARRRARTNLHEYILYTSNGRFKASGFSRTVCAALDKFISDVVAGKRPVLILQAPPQHGKSEMVSRKLPAYIMARFPDLRIATASYGSELAHDMAQNVRRNLASAEHGRLFPVAGPKRKFEINRMGEFTSPGGTGSYMAVGVGQGLTGRPVDIGIIDDPIKDQQEALSEVTKEGHWNWYQTVFTTRLSQNSGQIVMATSWAEDDLAARISAQYMGDDRLTLLKFPALNYPDETGYNRDLPDGPLVPDLKDEAFLREQKGLMSDYWWSALYQQNPKPLGGNVFKNVGIQFYLPKELPERFDLIIDSWDCTFKDTDGTDFVCGGKWGKRGANAYLLKVFHKRASFTDTCSAVKEMAESRPIPSEVLIEDKANGPAVIDFLKKNGTSRLIAVEPDGSKLARAHAVTSPWEARNVFIPHPQTAAWVTGSTKTDHFISGSYLAEMTGFPAAKNDDWVDMTTQALRRLFPFFGRLAISSEALKRAAQGGIARR